MDETGKVAITITVGVRKLPADYTPPRSHEEAALRDIARIREACGADAQVQVHANSMAAGPCAACLEMASEPIPLGSAPTGPLPECPHPDQCVLRFHVVISFD